ncbi:MAG TPA: outer membrane protein assembly factor BamD [Bacteroidales bacterium]|nr:outer membrane protein assembly factor BamD [Bacteroidales bacterium]
MRFRLYILLIILVLVSSCGEYERLLKSTDNELKVAKAKEYYNAGLYVKSSELLTQVLPQYRATKEADELTWIYCKSFYGMKDYVMASTYFKQFVDQFPFGRYAEEANFLAAMSDYKMSPRAELDQENTRNAIEGFKIFISRFPVSTKVEESKKMIKELEDKLSEKSYLSAKLYYDMRQYKAAVTALNNSLKEFSDTKYREEMMFLKLNSMYLYAEKSQPDKQVERYQEALDEYFSFVEEFPQSRYSKEVKGIYQKTDKHLKKEITDSGVNN